MNDILALLGGVVVLVVLGGLALVACLVIAGRAGVSTGKVTDMSDIADVRGKVGQFKTMLAGVRDVFAKMIGEVTRKAPPLAKVFTARGMGVVCFALMLMLFFGAAFPFLRFTWGFTRVDFGVLWFLQAVFCIVFAAALAQKYFRFLLLPIGSYFCVVLAQWPVQAMQYGGGFFRAFGDLARWFWSFAGVVFLLSLIAAAAVFFLTYWMNRLPDARVFIITCLAAIPVNYLAQCVSCSRQYGGQFGLLAGLPLLVDFSSWAHAAFFVGLACLALANKAAGRQAAAGPAANVLRQNDE